MPESLRLSGILFFKKSLRKNAKSIDKAGGV